MKTISGNIYIQEGGVLNSTNSGRNTIVQEFLKHFRENEYSMNPDGSITLEADYIHIRDKRDIPVYIKSCTYLDITNCEITTFTLPQGAARIEITDCNKLKEVYTKESSEIEELTFKNCENLDVSNIKNLSVKRLKFINCGITSLDVFDNVESLIYVKKCKKLKDYDLKCDNVSVTHIEMCKFKNFKNPLNSNHVELVNLKKISTLAIPIGVVEDLRIEDCDDLETIQCTGNALDVLVFKNLENVKKIDIVDCKESVSFVRLPKIEEYGFPKKINGVCVFEKVAHIPENVPCKKKIIRQ